MHFAQGMFVGTFYAFVPTLFGFRIKALKVENLFAEEQKTTEVCEAAIYFKELKWQKPQATHVNVCVCVSLSCERFFQRMTGGGGAWFSLFSRFPKKTK